MVAHQAGDRGKSTRSPSRAAEFPNRNHTKLDRCGRSTCTLPREPRGEWRWHSLREQQATAQTPSTQRSTNRYRTGQTRKVSAREACPRCASQAVIGSKQENHSPELIHAHRSAEPVAARQLKTRPHKQTQASAK